MGGQIVVWASRIEVASRNSNDLENQVSKYRHCMFGLELGPYNEHPGTLAEVDRELHREITQRTFLF